MKYPTASEVEIADHRQLGEWYRFLESPGMSALDTDPIMPLIQTRDNVRVLVPPRGVLTVFYSMWRKDKNRPAYTTNMGIPSFNKLQEARDFAKANGYSGIRIQIN